MPTKQKGDEYELKMTGAGFSIERTVDESVAREIMSLVMGRAAGDGGGNAARKPGLNPGATLPDANTPKGFMSGKRPTTDMERVTCLGYFLAHYRDTNAFKTKELTNLNIEAAGPKLSNISATARNAVTQGLLALAGSGRKQVTERGEAVVAALPDRDKVAAALKEHRARKARKKRHRKAK
jgi:hypothetical protein